MDPSIEPVSAVLRCTRCNKPFDKESTLKRHNYYCRSKKTPVSRIRSCVACAKRKSRCDGQKPACARCVDRGITCAYPSVGRPRQTSGPTPGLGDATDGSTPGSDDSVPSHVGSTPVGSDATDITVPAEWDASEFGFLPDFSDPQTYEALDFSTPPPLTGPGGADFTFSPNQQHATTAAEPVNNNRKNSLIPLTIAQLSHIVVPPPLATQPAYLFRSLEQRPATKQLGREKPASLVLKTLKSYVLMMTRPQELVTPPPFLHPKLMRLVLAPEGTDNGIVAEMEPLHNCISLLHMAGSRVPGSRKLFWRTVRGECERLHALHAGMSKWEALYGMQALFLYIIMRLDEGPTEDNRQVDLHLVAGVTALATHLASFAATEPDIPSTWNDWIFEESRRRLCVVYQIINMLVFFEPAAMCHLHTTDILIAPLPAPRPLWEAVEESSWRTERSHISSYSPRDDEIYALAGSGEIVKLKQARPPCHEEVAAMVRKPKDADGLLRSTASWDEWLTGMDGLGGLVMLAASLIQ
ncbi:hypothetical protein QBC47DRAFT_366346 [Echria macrotheca]|uniref:Zn(2)-C6 fungal-type domain-containing protein n=1 Tax=Echria macrotheca TaxID=438768 RepID=A0AAJ0F9C7_9PEZI|nr:hypothetical protein QBC47DRAFT_366346 [Echria macrotheca]